MPIGLQAGADQEHGVDDAQSMAHICPMGMVFVPSVRGISHAPEEFTEPGDVVNGADVLLRTLLALDAGAGIR